MATFYTTDSKLGVNLDTVSSTQPDIELGEIVEAQDGQEWILVQANGALEQYEFVAITEAYQAAPLSHTNAKGTQYIGVSQWAASDDDYLWVPISGTNIQGLILVSAAADTKLYTQATAGRLDDVSVTNSVEIKNVHLVTAGHTTGTAAAEYLAAGRMKAVL